MAAELKGPVMLRGHRALDAAFKVSSYLHLLSGASAGC